MKALLAFCLVGRAQGRAQGHVFTLHFHEYEDHEGAAM